MKIKHIFYYKNKLLKLKLLRTKVYKKNETLLNLKIGDIECRLKKGLQIIYKYNLNNKKITFVSNSLNVGSKIKNLLQSTKHSFISEHSWLNGIITNKKAIEKNFSKTNTFYKVSKLKTSLIVVLGKLTNDTILKEAWRNKTPLIFLGGKTDFFFNTICCYKILGSFSFNKKIIRNNFFIALLKATLKKSKQIKKKYNTYEQLQYKLQKKSHSKFKFKFKKQNRELNK